MMPLIMSLAFFAFSFFTNALSSSKLIYIIQDLLELTRGSSASPYYVESVTLGEL